jgi:hypothetical protein
MADNKGLDNKVDASDEAVGAALSDKLYAAAQTGVDLGPVPETKRAQIVNGKASFIDPDSGDPILVPLDRVEEYARAGFIPEESTQYDKRKEDEYYADATGEAFITRAMGAVTFGLTDYLADPGTREHYARLQEANPTASLLGSVGGTALSLGTGWLGLIGKGAKIAAKGLVATVVKKQASKTIAKEAVAKGSVISVAKKQASKILAKEAVVEQNLQRLFVSKLPADVLAKEAVVAGINKTVAKNLATSIAGNSAGISMRGLALKLIGTQKKIGNLAYDISTGLASGVGQSISTQSLAHPEGDISGLDVLRDAGIGGALGMGFNFLGSALGAASPMAQKWITGRAGQNLPKGSIGNMADTVVRVSEKAEKPVRDFSSALKNIAGDKAAREFDTMREVFMKSGTADEMLAPAVTDILSNVDNTSLKVMLYKLGLRRLMTKSLITPHTSVIEDVKPIVEYVVDIIKTSKTAANKLQKMKTAYAQAFPSVDKMLTLPAGFGKVGVGIGAGVLTGNPVIGVLASVIPWALRKAIGSPYTDTLRAAAMRASGKTLPVATENMFGRLVVGSTTAGTLNVLSERNIAGLRKEMDDMPSIDTVALADNLVSAGWEKEQASSYAQFQSWRENKMRESLDTALNNPKARADASAKVIALNDPRIPLSKLADGTATRADINILKEMLETFMPGAWGPVEAQAMELLDIAKRETVPYYKISLARMILGKSPSPLAAQPAKPAQAAKPGIDMSSQLTSTQKLQTGLGKA